MADVGEISRVAGPVVTATGISPRMYDVIQVGKEKLMGEVIKIIGNKTVIQVYEDTSGVRPGEPVVSTGLPLVAELGPGLLGSVYDGILRPLPELMKSMGDFIQPWRDRTRVGPEHQVRLHPGRQEGRQGHRRGGAGHGTGALNHPPHPRPRRSERRGRRDIRRETTPSSTRSRSSVASSSP